MLSSISKLGRFLSHLFKARTRRAAFFNVRPPARVCSRLSFDYIGAR